MLNKETSTWEPITWNFSPYMGCFVWSDNSHIYYSYGTDHYILDKESLTWVKKTWNGNNDFLGNSIWTDGTYFYLTEVSKTYKFS